MRLLDSIAQSASPPDFGPEQSLPAAHHFADQLQWCPLRLVVSDDLARCAAELAYNKADRLCRCLDLVRIPAQCLWVEWAEPARQSAKARVPKHGWERPAAAKRAGMLIHADAAGRAGTLRTFWSDGYDNPYTAALITEFDLDRPIRRPNFSCAFEGACVGAALPLEPTLDELLRHIRVRFAPEWVDYYRAETLGPSEKSRIFRAALGTTAFDVPLLLALLLLMAADIGVECRRADLSRVNRSRRRSGLPPLLEHAELCGPFHSRAQFPGSPDRGRFRSRAQPISSRDRGLPLTH